MTDQSMNMSIVHTVGRRVMSSVSPSPSYKDLSMANVEYVDQRTTSTSSVKIVLLLALYIVGVEKDEGGTDQMVLVLCVVSL